MASLQACSGAHRWRYRDRVSLSTGWDQRWQFGLTRGDELIEIPDCPVHTWRVTRSVAALGNVLPPGDRFPMAFYVHSGAQATLVLKTHDEPALDWLAPELYQRLEAIGLEGLWLNLNPSAGRRLFLKRGWRLLWGQHRSTDAHGLRYGPEAFQQLLPELYHRALDEAEAFLSVKPQDLVCDLYCGLGSSLSRWQARGADIIGVELGGEAVSCANENVPSAQVLRGSCATRLPQLRSWVESKRQRQRRLLMHLNPPRTGVEPEVLRWIVDDARPARITYLSCSAGTLRRDLDLLTRGGYQVLHITPYDFFPQTHHVEALVLLRRVNH